MNDIRTSYSHYMLAIWNDVIYQGLVGESLVVDGSDVLMCELFILNLK